MELHSQFQSVAAIRNASRYYNLAAFFFPKDQKIQIEETSAYLLSHWSIILVQVRQHTVNPGCQGWWLADQDQNDRPVAQKMRTGLLYSE